MDTMAAEDSMAKNKQEGSEMAAPSQRPPADAKKEEQPSKSAKKKDLQDSDLPAPLANGACKVILEELPDDSRVALESCLQFWRERRFPTEELVGFLKTISNQSATLKKGFNDQHQGFLQAMKLQEEQQRRRQQEEMSQMQWAHYQGPMHPQDMMRSAMPPPGWGHHPHPHAHPHPHMPMHHHYPGYPPAPHTAPHHMQPVGPYVPVDGPAAFHNDLALRPAQSGGHPHADPSYLRPLDNRFSNWHLSHLQDRMGNGRVHANSPKRRGRGSADTLEKLTEAVEADGRVNPARVVTDMTHKRLKDNFKGGADAGPPAPGGAEEQPKKVAHWQPSDKELADAKKSLGGFRPRDLKEHPLGEFLTQKVQRVNPSVVVKVVADTRKTVGPVGEDGRGGGSYRCKGILVFRCLPGSVADAITFGMYTHEYGAKAPSSHRGRVLVDCIDSTPLYSGETPEERQRSLTAVVQGYLEWVAKEGYAALLLRVPPPNDESWHLFAQRSFAIRLRACQHMSSWFKGILQDAMSKRVITDFRGSPALDFPGFPLSLLQDRDLDLEASFRQAAQRGAQAGRAAELGGLDAADRFFVALLPSHPAHPDRRTLGESCPFIYSHVAEHRLRFMAFCARQKLRFHTVPNAQYSTMILLKELQQQRLSLEPLDEGPGRRSDEGESWDEEEGKSVEEAPARLPTSGLRAAVAAPAPPPAPSPPDDGGGGKDGAAPEGEEGGKELVEEGMPQDWLAEAELGGDLTLLPYSDQWA